MMSHTRRGAIKLLGAGAAVAAAPWVCEAASAAPAASALRYFSLADVRLGPGPFLRAQELDVTYLLQLEPDRMLANFRKNAGLEPRAPVYGGWESIEPWVWIRCHGHTLGHYLTAAACMYESTDDARFAERIDYIVAELDLCQAGTGGWLTAFPDGVAPLLDSLAGKEFAGVPWYTTHKVLAGLRDAHVHRGSKQALAVARRFADWIHRVSADVPEDAFQKMLDREHGGMNEVLADLYALTGERRYADLARRFTHLAILRPLAEGVDALDGLHANTQIPKVIGFSRMAETLDGLDDHATAARNFWRFVTARRSFVTGGHGDAEHFFPVDEFAKHLHSGKTMETCCTHNMLRLTRSLYAREPRAEYFDYFERALINGILASQDPETGMNTYFQSTRPGYVRLYHTPFDSFWCCTGSGIENHARYGESIYAEQGGTLYVNLFIASTLQWRERGLTVTQTGNFPDSDTVEIRFDSPRRQDLELKIRHPAWCDTMTLEWNDKEIAASRQPGSYVAISRARVKSGDTLRIKLPMKLRLEELPGAPEHVAFVYGPVVLAARLGTEGLTPGSQLIVNERESGKMLQSDVQVPRWTRPLGDLPGNTTRTRSGRLEFRVAGFEGGRHVDLLPWFRLTHERYQLYFHRS